MKVQPEPKPAVQKAPKAEAPEEDSAKSNDDSQEMQEIPIAGRTKMTVPKNKDNTAPKQEPAAKGEDNTEAKDELNGILKRSPSMFAARPGLGLFLFGANYDCLKSSFSPSPIAPLAQKPSRFCLTSTPLSRRLMWSNSTSTHWGKGCRPSWQRLLAVVLSPMSWLTGRVLGEVMMWAHWTKATDWPRH